MVWLRWAESISSRRRVGRPAAGVRFHLVAAHTHVIAHLTLCGVKCLVERKQGILTREGFHASSFAWRLAVGPVNVQVRRLTGKDLLAGHRDGDADMEAIALFMMAMGYLHDDLARQDVWAESCELGGTLLDLTVEPLAARHVAIGNVSRGGHKYLDF